MVVDMVLLHKNKPRQGVEPQTRLRAELEQTPDQWCLFGWLVGWLVDSLKDCSRIPMLIGSSAAHLAHGMSQLFLLLRSAFSLAV